MITLISTEKSALNIHKLSEEWVEKIKHICKEIDPLLNVKPEIIVFGKVCHQNRNVGFFSDVSVGYAYSGRLAESIQMTDSLRELLSYVNSCFSTEFNGILVNKYENGENCIGKHSDDERALDRLGGGVVAISSGASRKFRIRDKRTDKIITDIQTRDDEIIQMAGDFQKEFTHEIPIEKKVKDARFSFTFRHHMN